MSTEEEMGLAVSAPICVICGLPFRGGGIVRESAGNSGVKRPVPWSGYGKSETPYFLGSDPALEACPQERTPGPDF
ncbi:MAG: hypothetical protein RLZZ244_545 [Verrucomicrobiota bacterium]|jgi:hypothetical protein